jgi:YbgC/YbaW family acyl-CoA thioester hydrolase
MNELLKQNEEKTESLHLKWPVHKRRIHVYETDKDGVVHFSNYLRIAEEAVFAGFRAIGFPLENEGNSIAMLKTNISYYKPIKFAENIDVVLGALDAKRVRFSLEFDFLCKGELCAQIQLVFATIAPNERKAIPLNPKIRNALASLLIDSEKQVKQQLKQII